MGMSLRPILFDGGDVNVTINTKLNVDVSADGNINIDVQWQCEIWRYITCWFMTSLINILAD